jgi:ABC-type uncharacterized transport system permease subunit
VRRILAAAAASCLGLFGLWYGFASTSEALKVIFVGTGLVLTSIGVTWQLSRRQISDQRMHLG